MDATVQVVLYWRTLVEKQSICAVSKISGMFLVFSFIILGVFSDMFLQKITFEYEAEPQLFLACS